MLFVDFNPCWCFGAFSSCDLIVPLLPCHAKLLGCVWHADEYAYLGESFALLRVFRNITSLICGV